KLIAWTRDTLADASLKNKIRSDVAEGMEKRQREFLLRQQMDAIKKELGEGDSDVAADYRKKIDEAGMPEAVRKEVERELDRPAWARRHSGSRSHGPSAASSLASRSAASMMKPKSVAIGAPMSARCPDGSRARSKRRARKTR